jgi:hypothetical protein
MGFMLARSVRTRLGRGPSTTCGRTNNIASSRNRPPTLARRSLLALAGRRLLLALAGRRLLLVLAMRRLLALATRRLLALATRRLPKPSHASAPKRNEHCVAATRRNALL